jgi:hypothetical protein
MLRFKDQDGKNELLLEAGDTGFLGVNSRLDPGILHTGAAWRDVNDTILGPGIVSHALNCRFRRGVAETRPGSVAPRCFNPVSSTVDTVSRTIYGVSISYQGGTAFEGGGTVNTYNGRTDYAAIQQGALPWKLWKVRWTGTAWAAYRNDVLVATATGDAPYPWDCDWGDPAVIVVGKSSQSLNMLENVAVPTYFGPTFFGGPIHGTGIFSDPDGMEWLMVAGTRGVWMLRDGQTPWLVGVPADLDGPVDLVQTWDSVVMLRGFDKDPLAWAGRRGEEFQSIQRTSPPGGSDFVEAIPPAESGAVSR